MLKAITVCYVEHNYTCFRASIERGAKRLVPFLSGGVPDLYCYSVNFLINVHFYFLAEKVSPYGRFVGSQTGLAYVTVLSYLFRLLTFE